VQHPDRHSFINRPTMGNKKAPAPNDGSKSRFLYKGLSWVYPTRSRIKSTTSSRVKTAPRDFVADVAGNVNSTSKENFA
jgi:hypothetical protein